MINVIPMLTNTNPWVKNARSRVLRELFVTVAFNTMSVKHGELSGGLLQEPMNDQETNEETELHACSNYKVSIFSQSATGP